ncbi:MAG: hypothetical protein IT315_08380 [Anaerolineales bacterium]|nr:hypothetical protein [Anaerolineales bacterium]
MTMNLQDDFDTLEERLAGTLKPVSPPRDLIQRLRERVRFPAREEIVLRFQDWRKLFLIFGGVMSGLLVLITVARAFFHLARKQM